MKIVTFWGGLGNQLFEYFYYKWLQNRYPDETIYGFYPLIGLSNHNGLEITNHFDVSLPRETILSNVIGSFLFHINRILRKFHFVELDTCTQKNEKYESVFHCDYWQDKRYVSNTLELEFSFHVLSKENQDMLDFITSSESVAIHIRRGDYLKDSNVSIYGGICTEEYYNKAISRILIKYPNAKLIFFSDDSDYVKNVYKYSNMTIIDWNKGYNSIYDMFIMSQCKHMVIANSTFSYWAARLNKKAKTVYCPSKWTNSNPPDIILNSWEVIEI